MSIKLKQLWAEAQARILKGEQIKVKRISKEKVKERKEKHHEK